MLLRIFTVAAALVLFGASPRAQVASGVASGSAQAGAATPAQPSFADQPFVYQSLSSEVTFTQDGSSTRQITASVRIQSVAGVQQFSVLAYPYPSANATLEFTYVRVVQPDGKVIETPLAGVQDMPTQLTQEAPYFSDIHEKEVAVSGLAAGDVLEYQLRLSVKNLWMGDEFAFDYNFDTDGVVLAEELEVRVPAERYVNVQSSGAPPTVSRQGNQVVYLWKTSNLKPAQENATAGQAPPPVIELTTFRNWDEVGQWYRRLAAPEAVPTAAIRAKAQQLTAGMTGEDQKLRAIYNYVSLDVRYVGVAFGIGRFQPHAAEEVLSGGYGDCKDKVTLLSALLAAEGIKAFPALISSTARLNPGAPSPGQFDHVIAVVPEGTSDLWLDATVGVAPPGFLLPSLRGKQALVIPDNATAQLQSTPANPPSPDSETFQADAKLGDDGTLDSKMTIAAQGDFAIVLRLLFRATSQAQWTQLAQNLSQQMGFGGTVSNVTVSPTESTDPDFQFQYDYERKDYPDWSDSKEITAPLPPPFLPAANASGQHPNGPIHLGSPGEYHFMANLTVPPGYAPELDATVNSAQDFATYDATYSFANGILHVERTLVTKAQDVSAADADRYKQFVQAVSKDFTSYTRFTKNAAPGPSASTASSTAPDAAAEQFYQQGYEETQQGDCPDAAQSYQKAIAADPQYAPAWSALGLCHVEMHDINQGTEQMEKAIAMDPHFVAGYRTLALTQFDLQEPSAALATWQQLEKVDPNNSEALVNSGSILLSLNRDSEAIGALEAAAKLEPTDSHLFFELGQAYLDSNDPEKALPAFQQTLHLDPNEHNLNGVAYALADKGAHLDLALQYAQEAVQKVEAETGSISPGLLGSDSLPLMTSLAADWDTLGWAYFRFGQWNDAQKYLEASWNLSQSPLTASHLGQVYEKQGKRHEAEQSYSWALAANVPEHHALPTAEASMRASIAKANQMPDVRKRLLELAGSESALEEAVGLAREHLSSERTVDLPKLTKDSAVAEFSVLVGPGPKVLGAKFETGSAELRSATKYLISAPLGSPFPDAGPERILRRGLLDCEPEMAHCIFVLQTANDAVQASGGSVP